MPPAPFPPESRLRQSSQFAAVFRDGRRYVRSGLVVIVAPGGHGQARLGLALAKRRMKRAVDRNRVKRVIRESFRSARGKLDAVDIVVLARNGTAEMSNRRLVGQLHSIWRDVVAATGGNAGAKAARRHEPADRQ